MIRQLTIIYRSVLLCCFGCFCFALIFLPKAAVAGEVVFVPGLRLGAEYDDNIDFKRDSSDADSDFAGTAAPHASLAYNTERLNLIGEAEVDFKKYLHDTDYDRTNQSYQIETEFQAHRRWTLYGDYAFLRDETTDSRFEETGRAFQRKREQRHDAKGGVGYALTELSDIASFVSYQRIDFNGKDDVDYNLYTYALPYTKRFQNQKDTIRITPTYARYRSDDNEKADDYRLSLSWVGLISETVTFDISAGPRYTEVEDNDGETDSNWGGVYEIGLAKRGEVFIGDIRYSHDLRSSTGGEIINVDRIFVFADQRITERFGARFRGNGYYSNTENNNEPSDKVVSFELIPALYYMLTEDHFVELAYKYRNQRDLDEPGNPVAQQNQGMLNFVFRFPKRWD